MTTFFTPSGTNTSGFQRVGTDIKMITITDRLLLGLNSTDFDVNEKNIVLEDIYCVSAETNAISVGLSSLGGVASIVATATGVATGPDLLFYVPTERMRLTKTGLLAIGLTAPTAQLHVKEAADGYSAKFERNAGTLFGINQTTVLTTIGNTTNHPLSIVTNSVNAIYVDASQKVGIGNTSPVTTLGITGDVSLTGKFQVGALGLPSTYVASIVNNSTGACLSLLSSTAACGMLLQSSATQLVIQCTSLSAQIGTFTTSDLALTCNSSNVFYVFQATRNVQIGTPVADTGFKLYVNGSSKLDGAISYTDTITSTDLTKQVSLGVTKVGSTAAIDASAQLEVLSTTKGLLVPRMTTAQKNAVSSPAAGLVVYDSTLGKLCIRTGAAWETITSV